MFYADVPEEISKKAVEKLQPMALSFGSNKQTYAAWKHINSTYIVCEDDQAFTKIEQEFMATQPGANMTILRLEGASHSPFLSRPEDTASLVDKAIKA
jgi:hypothetical protein